MHFLSSLLSRLEEFRLLAYLFVALISFLESLAFVGLLIPGTVFLIVVGFIVSKGVWNPVEVFLFAVAGAAFGDAVSFYLGSHGKIFFQPQNKVFKPSFLEQGKRFFLAHGNKSVFLGRFVGPIRPIIPFVAGLCHMGRVRFFFYNLASALVWSGLYLTLGYFFGAALGAKIARYLSQFGIVLLVGVVIIGGSWLWYHYFLRNKKTKS